jgi:hypothetical protein
MLLTMKSTLIGWNINRCFTFRWSVWTRFWGWNCRYKFSLLAFTLEKTRVYSYVKFESTQNQYNRNYCNCDIPGVFVQAPQLDINTVAAGGGSRLFFRAGLFVVGPESAGAHPGLNFCFSLSLSLSLSLFLTFLCTLLFSPHHWIIYLWH